MTDGAGPRRRASISIEQRTQLPPPASELAVNGEAAVVDERRGEEGGIELVKLIGIAVRRVVKDSLIKRFHRKHARLVVVVVGARPGRARGTPAR